ncbi:MAG: FHA domain-containing protein [Spirochaetota bacterium]
MSLVMRIVFFGILGLAAGALAWPFAETVLFLQAGFPSLLLFNTALGTAIGLFMGGAFGMSEGVVSRSRAKIRSGVVTGMAVGVVGGIAGFVAGQAALLAVGTTFFHSPVRFQTVGIPVSRALGWAGFGMFIGMAEGIRSRSGDRVRNGIIGGFLGGVLGGLLVEYIRIAWPENVAARLGGLCVLGLLIGVLYGVVELRFTRAYLHVLGGPARGREHPLFQKVTVIGGSDRTEVTLPGYRNVADEHAVITRRGGSFLLTDAGTRKATYVNDRSVDRAELKDGDVIRVGDAQFQFREK